MRRGNEKSGEANSCQRWWCLHSRGLDMRRVFSSPKKEGGIRSSTVIFLVLLVPAMLGYLCFGWLLYETITSEANPWIKTLFATTFMFWLLSLIGLLFFAIKYWREKEEEERKSVILVVRAQKENKRRRRNTAVYQRIRRYQEGVPYSMIRIEIHIFNS